MDDEPKTVKELLVELKDASELMVDLAYAAVFFNEEKLAREVDRLEERMNGHLRRLRIMAMLAARSPEDAEGMAGVLWIADAIERIGDAASDIARVVAARLGIPDALRQRPPSRRRDDRAREDPLGGPGGRPHAPRPLAPHGDGDVGDGDPQRHGLAVRPGPRRRGERARRPAVRGPEEGVNLVRELAGAAPLPEVAGRRRPRALRARPGGRHPGGDEGPVGGGGRVSRTPRCCSTTGRSRPRSARSRRGATSCTTSWSRGCCARRPRRATPTSSAGCCVWRARASTICDSARDMTWYVEHGEPLHPVVQMALEETEETFAETVVEEGSTGRREVAAGPPRGDRDRACSSWRSSADRAGPTGRARAFVLDGRRPADLGRPRGGRGRAAGALQRGPAGRRGGH